LISSSFVFAMEPEYPRIYLYRRIVQAKLHIDRNFAETLDLDNIADEAAFSKFHFLRIFKKTYGRTPHQYLTYVRIEKAKELLADGLPVSEVCFSVGFDSLSSFSGLFRRVVGRSPSEFLAIQLNKKVELKTKPLAHIPGCYAEKKGWKAE
jgi:AraC-like DNA-binding protein